MKTVCLAILALRARWAAVCAWRMYWAQLASNPTMASRAREIAEERSATAILLEALDALFPLGYSHRWDRRAKP